MRGCGRDRGDGVTLVEGFVLRQHVCAEIPQVRGALSQGDDLVRGLRQVCACDDRMNAVHGFGGASVYRDDSSVGVRAADELGV